jgi:hypothetical protein
VMAKKEPKNEQAICKSLMQLIGERRGESVTPTEQPDTIERSRPVVESTIVQSSGMPAFVMCSSHQR